MWSGKPPETQYRASNCRSAAFYTKKVFLEILCVIWIIGLKDLTDRIG